MKKIPAIVFGIALFLCSCAPVIRQDLMEEGSAYVPFSDIRKNPDFYRGKLFILGGVIADTRVTQTGSVVEAVYVPVDSRGYLKNVELLNERYLAVWPRDRGLLDPLIYSPKKEITVAGEFIELRSGRIDTMEYLFPVFQIIDLYLWERRHYIYYYPYPYWWYYPW